MKESAQSFVLGFSGRIASGKSAVSKSVAAQFHYPRVSFGECVRSIARQMGFNDADRQILQDIGKLWAEHPREFCARVLAEAEYKPGGNLIIDGIRHKRIADELRLQIAPAELVLIYVEAEDAAIAHRLKERGHTDLDIQRLEQDPTEAEVLTVLPSLADLTVQTDNLRTVDSVTAVILEWVQHHSTIGRAMSSEEKVVVSRLGYERLQEELREAQEALQTCEKAMLTAGIMQMAEHGKAFDWLHEEEDLYTDSDLKVRYQ